MKASDIDKEDIHLAASSSPPGSDWLRIVGADIAIVLICTGWTFWNQLALPWITAG